MSINGIDSSSGNNFSGQADWFTNRILGRVEGTFRSDVDRDSTCQHGTLHQLSARLMSNINPEHS